MPYNHMLPTRIDFHVMKLVTVFFEQYLMKDVNSLEGEHVTQAQNGTENPFYDGTQFNQ